jgi:hypothetical protein
LRYDIYIYIYIYMSLGVKGLRKGQNSSVGILTGLQERRPRNGGSMPAETTGISLYQNGETGPGACRASSSAGNCCDFAGHKSGRGFI